MSDAPPRAPGTGTAGLRQRLAPLWRHVRARFTVDTRALAAMRIALGLTLLGDLLHRAQYLELFYTDSGVYPLSAAEATYTQFNGLSVHALSGALWFQQLLFVLAGLLALAFILGYRTRLVGLLSLLLLFSLHARNPGVLNGGDRLLRVVLFVALVAPLGERWSVDALRRGSAREQVASFGTAAVLVQPIAVFTSNALQKHQGEHWYAGEGLEIALHNDTMTIFLGDVIVEYPALLTALNYAWVGLLAGSIVLLGLTTGWPRALAALAYVGAFTGMAATMAVGVFPFALTAAVLPFLTTPFWDALARRVPATLTDRLPDAGHLGPLGRPPVERRLLDRLRRAGQAPIADYTVAYGRALLTVAGAAVLVWVVLFTAVDLGGYDTPGASTHLDQQQWGLYAPDPSDSYAWFVVEGELANGSSVDALDGGAVSYERPADAAAEYDSFRHRKYLQQVRDSGFGTNDGVIATNYATWACQRASSRQAGRVERVSVYRMYQESPIDGTYEEPLRQLVVRRDCASDPN